MATHQHLGDDHDDIEIGNATCSPVRVLEEPTAREIADPGGCTKESCHCGDRGDDAISSD